MKLQGLLLPTAISHRSIPVKVIIKFTKVNKIVFSGHIEVRFRDSKAKPLFISSNGLCMKAMNSENLLKVHILYMLRGVVESWQGTKKEF